MAVDSRSVKNGWVFPEGVPEPPDHAWHRFKIGDNQVYGFDWNHHIECARAVGLDSIDAEISASGDTNGMLYAGVRVEVTVNGESYACVHGAESASNQVRDPDMVFAVAESRATKRAVKKALGIVPADEDTSGASDSSLADNEKSGSSVDVDTSKAPDGVNEPPSEW